MHEQSIYDVTFKKKISLRACMYLKPDTCPPIASIQAAEIIEHLLEFGPTVNFNWVLTLST